MQFHLQLKSIKCVNPKFALIAVILISMRNSFECYATSSEYYDHKWQANNDAEGKHISSTPQAAPRVINSDGRLNKATNSNSNEINGNVDANNIQVTNRQNNRWQRYPNVTEQHQQDNDENYQFLLLNGEMKTREGRQQQQQQQEQQQKERKPKQQHKMKPRVLAQQQTSFNDFDDTININNQRSEFKSNATPKRSIDDESMIPESVKAKVNWPRFKSKSNNRHSSLEKRFKRIAASNVKTWSGNVNYNLNASNGRNSNVAVEYKNNNIDAGNSNANNNNKNSNNNKSNLLNIKSVHDGDAFMNTHNDNIKGDYINNNNNNLLQMSKIVEGMNIWNRNKRTISHTTTRVILNNVTTSVHIDNPLLVDETIPMKASKIVETSMVERAKGAEEVEGRTSIEVKTTTRLRPIVISSSFQQNTLPPPPPSPSPAPSQPAATTNSFSSSNFLFKDIEEMESKLSTDKRQQLVLTRRKRYLVFPEGSSFQLVFDLIIPIVDYTNFAIMGITCAVAWELPSKPPSELIENVRDKLNDGTLGTQRRNDTIEGLQYADALGYESSGTQKLNDFNESTGSTNHIPLQYNPEKLETNKQSIPMDAQEKARPIYTPNNIHPYYAAEALGTTTSNNDQYLNSPNNFNFISTSFTSQPSDDLAPLYQTNKFQNLTNTKPFLYSKYYNENYYNSNNNNNKNYDKYNKYKNYNNKYMNYKSGNTRKWQKNDYSYWQQGENAEKNRMQYSDWQRLPWRHADNTENNKSAQQSHGVSFHDADNRFSKATSTNADGNDSDNTNASDAALLAPKVNLVDYDIAKQVSEQLQPNMAQQSYSENSNRQQKDDAWWWQRNKERVEQQWSKYKQKTWSPISAKPRPITTTTTTNEAKSPSNSHEMWQSRGMHFSANNEKRNERKILTTPPKHHIFPIFGKRRRRRKRDLSELENAIDLEMEGFHYREHLVSRKNLYNKLEKVFTNRGHNGTACVLRALCETGQRHSGSGGGGGHHRHNYYHHNHRYHQKQQHYLRNQLKHEEPQSFIAELLRAIFTLPKDIMPSQATALIRKRKSADRSRTAVPDEDDTNTKHPSKYGSSASTFGDNHSINRMECLNCYHEEHQHQTNAGANKLSKDNAADVVHHTNTHTQNASLGTKSKQAHTTLDYNLEPESIKAFLHLKYKNNDNNNNNNNNNNNKNNKNNNKNNNLEYRLESHYHEAHAFEGDCFEKFSSCEFSIWNNQL